MSKAYTKDSEFAVGLDDRNCIWWGVLCVWDWFRNQQPTSVKAALDVCVRWYQEPNEENRIAAGQLVKGGQENPAVTMLLRAVYYTGNVAPKDCPPVRLDGKMSRQMVAACLDVLLSKVPVSQREDYVARFEKLRLEISVA